MSRFFRAKVFQTTVYIEQGAIIAVYIEFGTKKATLRETSSMRPSRISLIAIHDSLEWTVDLRIPKHIINIAFTKKSHIMLRSTDRNSTETDHTIGEVDTYVYKTNTIATFLWKKQIGNKPCAFIECSFDFPE